MFAVLPDRELAAAFAGLGCLLAGARTFEDALSWPKFRNLPVGHGVFWSPKNGKGRYQGTILGFRNYSGAEFIALQVTKAPRRAEIGCAREISERYFDDYRFTAEQPPSVARTESFEGASRFLADLIDKVNPKWIWADGAEGILVTSVTKFERAIADVSLSVELQAPIAMVELLCLGKNRGQGHAKLRIDHPRGTLSSEFPLAILDGAAAFLVHEHLPGVSNMLVILNRSEYQEEIHGAVLQLRSIADHDDPSLFQNAIPDLFAPGIELAAYLIDRR